MRRRGHTLRRRYGHSAEGRDFASWAEVMAAAHAGETLYYKAPLDYRPSRITPGKHTFGYEARARTLRIYPAGSIGRGRFRTADPFTADAKHLDRFTRGG